MGRSIGDRLGSAWAAVMHFDVRPARSAEAPCLSDLALLSKAHWGYDRAFLEACRDELTVSAADIESDVVNVADRDGDVLGFYLLRGTEDRGVAELDFLYVAPQAIGGGCGTVLWRHMVREARRAGYARVLIHSDPHAEGFYRKCGARRVGEVPSGSFADRVLPLMRFEIDREVESHEDAAEA